MLDFSARVADRDFEAALTVGTGETVAILGPNGAGKTTLLNVIAGLIRPDSGHALLRGRPGECDFGYRGSIRKSPPG